MKWVLLAAALVVLVTVWEFYRYLRHREPPWTPGERDAYRRLAALRIQQDWMDRIKREMRGAVERGEPFVIYRSGETPRELRDNLEQELQQCLAVLPGDLRVVGLPEYILPEAAHNGSYDGEVRIRLSL